ncbi:MAG: polysaccharide deacetylase family protein [Candidatus Harrisonbacteria bacterium]|nr:polysaccharide deacetylase family protein [Candidatus Harrisonbacteria bacterium]
MIFLPIFNFLLIKIDKLFFASPAVLIYHSVSDGETPISVSSGNFEKQMAFLDKSGAKVISLQDFLDFKNGLLKLKGRNVLITFDDAFKDIFINAMPILKKYNFPAVVFINPALLGKKAVFATKEKDKQRSICSLPDLKSLEKSGAAIANHGYSHKSFSELTEAEIVLEYKKSENFIKENFKENSYPDVFVFPKGAGNQLITSFLNERGARVLNNRTDIYANTSLFKFVFKLSGFYFWLRHKIFV